MISALQVRTLAENLLGHPLTPEGYAPCPGAHLHTTPTGTNHWRLYIDPENPAHPHDHCFHASCAPARDAFMSRLYTAIRRLLQGTAPAPTGSTTPATPRRPIIEPPAKPVFNPARATQLAARCPHFTLERLGRISPIPIPPQPEKWPELLLSTLYPPRSRILIFTIMRSQGQYLYEVGTGFYRLAHRPGTRATPVPQLPLTTSADGMWYLAAPITGQWLQKPGKPAGELGRRHAACCTSFPYAVIESDTLPPETWLPCLAQLTDPIVAIYTSGKKSIHALIRLNATTPADFNHHRTQLIRRLLPIGADPAAITPVRLTRLPGATRGANLQRLLYLNPRPLPGTPLCRLSLYR